MTRNAETQQVHHLLKCGYGNNFKNAETQQMHQLLKVVMATMKDMLKHGRCITC